MLICTLLLFIKETANSIDSISMPQDHILMFSFIYGQNGKRNEKENKIKR